MAERRIRIRREDNDRANHLGGSCQMNAERVRKLFILRMSSGYPNRPLT